MPASSPEVTQAPLELIRLLKEAQQRDGRVWEEIDVAAGVRSATREGWLSGAVKSPPLIGIARLCSELGIPAEKVFEAVQRDGTEEVRRLKRDLDEELSSLSPPGEPRAPEPPGTPEESS